MYTTKTRETNRTNSRERSPGAPKGPRIIVEVDYDAKAPEYPIIEPVWINGPAVVPVLYMIVQLFFINLGLSMLPYAEIFVHLRRQGDHLSSYGLLVLWPTVIYGFYCMWQSMQIAARSNAEAQDFTRPRALNEGPIILRPGEPMTSEQAAREDSMNRSLYIKFFIFSICSWPYIFKTCLDEFDEFPWQACGTLAYVCLLYLLFVAFKHGNYHGTDQREINVRTAINMHNLAQEQQEEDDDLEDGVFGLDTGGGAPLALQTRNHDTSKDML